MTRFPNHLLGKGCTAKIFDSCMVSSFIRQHNDIEMCCEEWSLPLGCVVGEEVWALSVAKVTWGSFRRLNG